MNISHSSYSLPTVEEVEKGHVAAPSLNQMKERISDVLQVSNRSIMHAFLEETKLSGPPPGPLNLTSLASAFVTFPCNPWYLAPLCIYSDRSLRNFARPRT